MIRPRLVVASIALASAVAVATGGGAGGAGETKADGTGAIQTLEIQAADFSFEAPATVPAGRTRVVLHNATGTEPHQAGNISPEARHDPSVHGELSRSRRALYPGFRIRPYMSSDRCSIVASLEPSA